MRSQATAEDAGKRLDRFLAEQMPETSRARIQQWIRDGRVTIDQAPGRVSFRLRGTELIAVDPGPAKPLKAFAEEIPLDILYEDEDIAAINKPAGMTVHAGGGATSGTLVNALLHHFGKLSGTGGELRPGIVHRLDRLTSGVLLIAKNDRAHRRLARQFQSRQVKKTYWALVHGDATRRHPKGRRVEADGQWWTRLEMPVHRDRRQRAKMTAGRSGRSAQTDFRPLQRWPSFTLLEVRIATGRTIRSACICPRSDIPSSETAFTGRRPRSLNFQNSSASFFTHGRSGVATPRLTPPWKSRRPYRRNSRVY